MRPAPSSSPTSRWSSMHTMSYHAWPLYSRFGEPHARPRPAGTRADRWSQKAPTPWRTTHAQMLAVRDHRGTMLYAQPHALAAHRRYTPPAVVEETHLL